jgi:hypothetical protein
MAGNRNKTQSRKRLAELGITPGFLPPEEAAAFFDMSVNAFETWTQNDPTAPQPYRFGGCKRWKVSELQNSGRCDGADRIMERINAHKST